MKKNIILLFLLLICILSSCTSNELYIIQEATDSVDSQELIPILNYVYDDFELSYAKTPSEYLWYGRSSRGIIFMPNDGIMRVYNPEIGSFNPLCPDPLCTHYPYSGCPYGNCIFTGSIPIEYDSRFYYFVKDEYYKNEQIYSEYIIYSTDLTGQTIEKLYQNSGNYMFGLTIQNECAYFLEFFNENSVKIKSINLKTRKINELEHGEDDAIIISFLIMDKTIYYMLDTGEIYSCDLEFNNVSFQYNTKRAPTMYGLVDTGNLYWFLDNTIYEYNPTEKKCSVLLSVEPGLHLINFFVEDEGLYYQAVPNSVTYSLPYKDYITGLKGYNTLYLIDPRTMKTESFDLPDDLYLEPNTTIICNGLLISQTFIENRETKKLAGCPYKAYDLDSKKIYTITEVKGY